MADIRRLDGTVIDGEKPKRDERIAKQLAELTEKNDRGELKAIVSVYLTPEAMHGAHWTFPLEDFGYPWGLAMRGALLAAMQRIGDAETSAPDRPEPAA